jgi:serine/threonine-protein kinase
LHNQSIVHRDLKPGNILLSNDGKVKLTDFGLAFSQAMPSLTIEGSILGTPTYMPPEQILGKTIDYRSDIYSLGVVFYELLTGTNPFVADTYSAIMHNVLNLKPVPVYKADKSLENTKDLWQIIDSMLRKPPTERPENISTVTKKIQVWFDKDANKNWQLNITELNTEASITAPPLSQKPKTFAPKSRSGIARRVWILIILAVMFTMLIIISIIQIRKNKAKKIFVTNNSADSIQTLPSRSALNQESLPGIIANNRKDEIINTEEQLETPFNLPVAVKTTANIIIQALPWATVYIDDNEMFTTPKDTSLELSAGQHSLKLINPNFPVFESTFSVSDKQELKLIIDLRDKISYLQISVIPWADIYIDDEFKATTPISQPLIISSGKHKITLKNPYYTPYQEIIEFNPHETVERNIVLK